MAEADAILPLGQQGSARRPAPARTDFQDGVNGSQGCSATYDSGKYGLAGASGYLARAGAASVAATYPTRRGRRRRRRSRARPCRACSLWQH